MIKLVPVDEAAREVGLSRVTLFKYLDRGLLRRYRRPGLDRRTYVDLVALRALKGVDVDDVSPTVEEATADV